MRVPWSLLTTFWVAARQAASLSLTGIEISITVTTDDGKIEYLEQAGTNLLDITTNPSAASTFVLQDYTGYLYLEVFNQQAPFTSGYAIPTIPYGSTTYSQVTLVDSATALAGIGTIYQPLICSPAAGNILNCAGGPLASTPLASFGFCNTISSALVVFGAFQTFVTNCGGTSDLLDTFSYTTEGIVNGGLGIGAVASGVASTPSSTAGGVPQGSCSVTLMLYLASTTTYVAPGYVASVSAVGGGGIVGLSSAGLGGAAGAGGAGCSPVTSTVHI